MTETTHTLLEAPSSCHSETLELVEGLAAEEVDRRLVRANLGVGLGHRVLAFYLHGLDARRQFQQLGYPSTRAYAFDRLDMDRRRTNEYIKAGGQLLDLVDIDNALLSGRLCWSKVKTLLRVARTSNQDLWIERAMGMNVRQLEKAVSQARLGQRVTGGKDGGLPVPMFEVQAMMTSGCHDKFERIREELMKKRRKLITDDDIVETLVELFEFEAVDPAADAERRQACETDATPQWLRDEVRARDGFRCVHCGTAGELQVHHIEFRQHGGLTRAELLASVCTVCHGLIHDGFLTIRGRAPDGLEFLSRTGVPLKAPAQRIDPVIQMLRPAGSREPAVRQKDLPDGTTVAWLNRQPELGWSLVDGLLIHGVAVRRLEHGRDPDQDDANQPRHACSEPGPSAATGLPDPSGSVGDRDAWPPGTREPAHGEGVMTVKDAVGSNFMVPQPVHNFL